MRSIILTVSLIFLAGLLTWLLKSDVGQRIESAKADRNVRLVDDGMEGETASKPEWISAGAILKKQTLGKPHQNESQEKNASAAQKIYIDPVTGKIVPRPVGSLPFELSAELQNGLSTSSEGLREIESPVAGGGMMIRLEGRFQNANVATIDAEGKVQAPCLSTIRDLEKSIINKK